MAGNQIILDPAVTGQVLLETLLVLEEETAPNKSKKRMWELFHILFYFRTFVTQALLTPNFLANSARLLTFPESNNFRYSLACRARVFFISVLAGGLTYFRVNSVFAWSKNGSDFWSFLRSISKRDPAEPPLKTLIGHFISNNIRRFATSGELKPSCKVSFNNTLRDGFFYWGKHSGKHYWFTAAIELILTFSTFR